MDFCGIKSGNSRIEITGLDTTKAKNQNLKRKVSKTTIEKKRNEFKKAAQSFKAMIKRFPKNTAETLSKQIGT